MAFNVSADNPDITSCSVNEQDLSNSSRSTPPRPSPEWLHATKTSAQTGRGSFFISAESLSALWLVRSIEGTYGTSYTGREHEANGNYWL